MSRLKYIGSLRYWFSATALFLGSQNVFAETPYTPCASTLVATQSVEFEGWSNDLSQQRSASLTNPDTSPANPSQLELQWAFVFDGAVHPRSIPALTDQAIYLGDEDGHVWALDRRSGCSYWRIKVDAEVRTGFSFHHVAGKQHVYFGDLKGNVYSASAQTGQIAWQSLMDEHPVVRITATPALHEGVLYVPLSSYEVAHALNPFYNCCTFRGGIHAVDAATGKTVWKTHSIAEAPKQTGRNAIGVRQYGASGAPIWSPPTIDVKRGLVYSATGQNYSSPASVGSDSILAMDLHTGAMVWQHQLRAGDAWNAACAAGVFGLNCPEENGPDFDFGAPPILATNAQGKDFIIAGQKSGMVYALDPDRQGELLWSEHVGRGGILGGVHWGLAIKDNAIYVPISDVDLLNRAFPGTANPSISKLDLTTGKTLWHTPVNFDCKGIKGCRNGFSAAVTVTQSSVIAPGLDGVIHAYDTQTGKEVWAFDTKGDFAGVNGITGHGGTLDAGGAIVADGLLMINAGYGGMASAGGLAGNTFLVFALPSTP